MGQITWEELKECANKQLDQYDHKYANRLKFELREIEKQGATAQWINFYNDQKRFSSNPNMLVLPWLLGMVNADPLVSRDSPELLTARASEVQKYRTKYGHIPPDFVKDPDMPDIDLDCLPEARDPIKEYATRKYGMGVDDGYGTVCSVGTWQTYKFKSAMIDTHVALTGSEEDTDHKEGDSLSIDEKKKIRKADVLKLTTDLPDDVDELKEGGVATCKEHIIDKDGVKKECGRIHGELICPRCGNSKAAASNYGDKPHHGGSHQTTIKNSGSATDNPTIGKLIQEHDTLKAFAEKHESTINHAVNLIGRVRNMGMHAGALIIADRPLYGNIPLARSTKKGYWLSMWSEGRNTQLSKFGYIKWDILGLKTLKYIFECCRLIEQNRGIRFGVTLKQRSDHDQELPPSMSGWDDINPLKNRAGHFFDPDGNKHYIELNDKDVLRLANEQKTDGVFQFDTDLARSILGNGVRNFEDLMLFNAMGHPGPMASIPEAVANRDSGHESWKRKLHPEIADVLKDTYGVIVYQEQLQAIWQRVAGFTAPQAQNARKAVAKKWVHKLKPIRAQWIAGASRTLGENEAIQWWTKMETFGRYAFNRSHAVSYCLIAHRCLWLKANFAPEFWAAVMSDCHPKKLVRYMGTARAEKWEPTDITYCGKYNPEVRAVGVTFDTINIDNLTSDFTVTGDVVNQGLVGIKGIGDSAADKFAGRGSYPDIDDFIANKAKSKIVVERFIKMGAFKHLPGHENAYAVWQWYQYKYCSGKNITQLRKETRALLLKQDGWTEKTIADEIKRQIDEYRTIYPNRRKIPAKIQNWKPKPNDSRLRVISLYDDKEFSLAEVLGFEKKYLGYYLHSPLDLYATKGGHSISDAKDIAVDGGDLELEVVITDIDFAVSRNNNQYARLMISDGIQTALVLIFNNELERQKAENLAPGVGVQMAVDYDEMRGTFTLKRNEVIVPLFPQNWRKKQREADGLSLLDDA